MRDMKEFAEGVKEEFFDGITATDCLAHECTALMFCSGGRHQPDWYECHHGDYDECPLVGEMLMELNNNQGREMKMLNKDTIIATLKENNRQIALACDSPSNLDFMYVLVNTEWTHAIRYNQRAMGLLPLTPGLHGVSKLTRTEAHRYMKQWAGVPLVITTWMAALEKLKERNTNLLAALGEPIECVMCGVEHMPGCEANRLCGKCRTELEEETC